MNPFTWLYRRSRLFRVACYLLLVVVALFIWMVADDQFAQYTQVGDLTVLFGFMFFAAWAWWYGEDRDRRQAGEAHRRSQNGTGR